MPGTHIPHPSAAGSKSAAISNMTVRLLSQYTGRGPTKARTFVHDDVVTVVLQDTMTKGEITLVDHDHRESVLATRKTFQDVMGADLIAGVEEILQREVLAFLSANHIDPDIAVETFILVPAHDAASPRSPWSSSTDRSAPPAANAVADDHA
jgi:uncharacterized protein YbcI